MSIRSSASMCIAFLSLREQCTLIHPRLPEAGEQTSSLCLSESSLLCSELDRRRWQSSTATEQPPCTEPLGRTECRGLTLCSCCAPASQGLSRCTSLRAQEDACSPGSWFPPFYDRKAAEAEHILLWYWVSVLPLSTASAGDGEYPQSCARRGNPPEAFCAP